MGGRLATTMFRLNRLARHLVLPGLVGIKTAPCSTVALSGHYANLTGHCAEQALRAFEGEVAEKSKDNYSIATFAGGCFWGPQIYFDRVDGVVATSVGYVMGHVEQPTYGAICSGRSGHTEAVQVYFDDSVSYETILTAFWSSIDPTTANGQGNDHGSQYRTGIYCNSEAQMSIAAASLAEEQKKHKDPIATEVFMSKVYWPAEAEHQNYLSGGGRFGDVQSTAKGCTDKIRCYGRTFESI